MTKTNLMNKLLAFVVFSVIGYMTPLYAEKGEVTVEPELGGVVPVVDTLTGNIEAGHFGFKLGAGATYSD
ncbi:MAG: hypothetical protein DRR08_04025 [Candidatus Parabeggiatoa sp. nov. 2]|nr:MAG: hypothetical protein DRR08_04025 [Gammaproteobacteria bacterium]HEC85505.1 hypothetical protein [Thioploca sp.]